MLPVAVSVLKEYIFPRGLTWSAEQRSIYVEHSFLVFQMEGPQTPSSDRSKPPVNVAHLQLIRLHDNQRLQRHADLPWLRYAQQGTMEAMNFVKF